MENFSKTTKTLFSFAFYFFHFLKSALKLCRIINEPVELDNATIPHNFELPINQDKEECEDNYDLSEEMERLLVHEAKAVQPHQEPIKVINLGTKEENKEVKVRTTLEASIKERLVKILYEYVDAFSWSYQDLHGLDINIVEHRLLL